MKKLLCVALVLIMLLSVTAMADTGFAGGSGTKEDPWQIASAEQLNLIRENLAGHYVLIADIDLSGYENWEPIGAFQSLSDAYRSIWQDFSDMAASLLSSGVISE